MAKQIGPWVKAQREQEQLGQVLALVDQLSDEALKYVARAVCGKVFDRVQVQVTRERG